MGDNLLAVKSCVGNIWLVMDVRYLLHLSYTCTKCIPDLDVNGWSCITIILDYLHYLTAQHLSSSGGCRQFVVDMRSLSHPSETFTKYIPDLDVNR